MGKSRKKKKKIVVLFGALPYIINVRVSKYFVTFETTIWYLWELRLSRECPVNEASPSDASGVVSRLATTINKCLNKSAKHKLPSPCTIITQTPVQKRLPKEKYELQNEEELPVAMVRKKPG